MSWQELLFRRLTGAFAGYVSSPKTLIAERHLGLERSIYYGIGRNAPEFGEMIAVFDPIVSPESGAESNPFDTGGIAHGHIPLMADAPEPRILVETTKVPVEQHQIRLNDWASSAYTEPAQYRLAGEASRPRRPATPAIDLAAAADDRAWTWEGRIRAAAYEEPPTRLRTLFIKPGDLTQYQRWLRRVTPLDDAELSPHEDLVNDVSVETRNPYESMMEALGGGSHV